jgi:hypothetical protein
MKRTHKLIIALFLIAFSIFGIVSIASAEKPQAQVQQFEQTVYVAFRTGNLVPTAKRLQNQFGIQFNIDWNTYGNNETQRALEDWSQGVMTSSERKTATTIYQDVIDGDFVFTLAVPKSKAAIIPEHDTPNFSTVKSNEVDEQGDPVPWPTYAVYVRDDAGVIIGTEQRPVGMIQ